LMIFRLGSRPDVVRAKKIDVGGTCILNSDCTGSLVCTMGKKRLPRRLPHSGGLPTGKVALTTTTRPVSSCRPKPMAKWHGSSVSLCVSRFSDATPAAFLPRTARGAGVREQRVRRSVGSRSTASSQKVLTGVDGPAPNAQGRTRVAMTAGADLTVRVRGGAADIRPAMYHRPRQTRQ